MLVKYNAKITCTIDKEHPDIKYVENWTENKTFTFSDVYEFEDYHTEENIIAYIKMDLGLVAGGGYNTDHIHNVEFEIKKI